jgi:hypothetical protein
MGKAVKILDLAKRMISLYGYKPGVDIEIIFSGLRPGEKLNEELFNSYEKVKETSHDKINMADLNGRARRNVLKLINSMEESGFWENMGDTKRALQILLQVFSEEQPPSQVQILRVQFQDSTSGILFKIVSHHRDTEDTEADIFFRSGGTDRRKTSPYGNISLLRCSLG